ncbi:hypothetical protein PQR62_04045 [Herbaspirillum lusitanum]|jgi:hypothetical protein|uniref:Uncharacterized protein n=1 Tax=Herbaspirillum lusitanum TaxID=213312 RepID=A0ABW9A422_9BURK
MNKRAQLLKQLFDLKVAHDRASAVLLRISRAAVNINSGAPLILTRELLQEYRDAAKEAKLCASQAQIIVAEI